MAKRLEREISENEAKKALVEIGNFCKATAFFETVERTVSFLERHIYDEEIGQLGENGNKAFRELLQGKATLVSQRLYTDAMKQRSRRMETATAPCLEDLDVEVVEERHDDFRSTTVSQPFLRLRLRYSESSVPGSQLFIIPPFPWAGFGSYNASSFEVECDESDIDLLIYRLSAAKKLLMPPECDTGT